MARHLMWCLKSTLLLANRLIINRQSMPINKYSCSGNLRIYPQINKINVDYDEPKTFTKFAEESKSSILIATDTLMKILSVSKVRASKAINENPNFKNLPKKTICKNFRILRESGVFKSTIKDNIFLLCDTTNNVKKKINILEKLNIDINGAISLFNLSIHELARFEKCLRNETTDLPAPNRIQYLVEKLHTDVSTICRLLSYHPSLLKLTAPKLLTKTEFMLDSGVAPKDILNDPYAYAYQITTIREKIERAKKAGVEPLKPWLIRCGNERWEKIEKRQAQLKNLEKPDRTIEEYLSEIFECDIELAKFFILRNPNISKVHFLKLKAIAKLIHDAGYRIEDALCSPRVFYRNIETLKELLDVSKKLGIAQPPLFTLLLDKAKFIKLMAPRCSVVPEEPESES